MDSNDEAHLGDPTNDAPSPAGVDEVAKQIFDDASELPVNDREAFLRVSCGQNVDLRRVVETLLNAHDQAGPFLAQPTRDVRVDDIPLDRVIGRYKLLQRIGEGGFGTVYMAEQEQPVRRRVALKIIKLGMDTKAVIARFEAERQALAMMDHPNIAQVFDAGATDTGRPYFVMELVRGIPVTQFCDEAQLSVNARLELFVQICHAVQHAHQKGIIHRDIKPSNILVTRHDDRPLVKVIDFGIAKAIDQRLTEQTLFTDFGQMIGTPEYMSPEQAGGGLDIDTRSDVYSLGVLLYELLTGTTPFDGRELRGHAYAELQRVIREVDPPRPSTRLSTLGKTLSAVAAYRRTEAGKLGRLVRGDLDWIAMKALEKDRGRRYATASDLAADVLRHLSDEIVAAMPPSATYRLSKLLRRHKTAFIAVAVIALTVLIALVASITMYRRERAARNQTELARLHEQGQRKQAEVNFGLARDAVNRLTDIAQNRLMDPSELATVRRDMLEDAAKFFEAFVQGRSDNPAVIIETARAHRRAATLRSSIGQPWEAKKHCLQAIALIEGLIVAQPGRPEYEFEALSGYMDIGRLYVYELADPAAAENAFRHAKGLLLPLARANPEDFNTQSGVYWACMELSETLSRCDRDADALVELKEVLSISSHFAALMPDDLSRADLVAQALHRTGECAQCMGAFTDAEAHYRASMSIEARIHAANPEDEWTIWLYTDTKLCLSGMLTTIGRLVEGEQIAREVIAEIEPIAQRRSQYNHMTTHLAYSYENLGNALFGEMRFPEAHDAYVRGRDGLRRIYEAHPDAPARTLAVLYPLALCPDETVRDPAAAASIARAALRQTPRVQLLSIYLGASLYQTGDLEGAIRALQAAQQIGPNDLGFARYILALAQFRSGQGASARASLEQAEHWASVTPQRFREPRSFAAEARRVIPRVGTSEADSLHPATTPTTNPAAP